MESRKSAAKSLNNIEEILYEKGSTTIPDGSTVTLRRDGKQPVYLRKRNVIYKIICQTTGKFYIGSASFYDKRIGSHVSRLRKKTHWNIYLQAAWDKYGEDDFSFEIIEELAGKDKLVEREQYWLDTTKCYERTIGFNLDKIANSKIGSVMPEAAKRKIGDFWRGKKFSQERIDAIRKARTLAQGKAVLVYDKNMNLLHEFCSISETSRQLNVSIAAVSKQCKLQIGDKRTYKTSKYVFRYKDIV